MAHLLLGALPTPLQLPPHCSLALGKHQIAPFLPPARTVWFINGLFRSSISCLAVAVKQELLRTS